MLFNSQSKLKQNSEKLKRTIKQQEESEPETVMPKKETRSLWTRIWNKYKVLIREIECNLCADKLHLVALTSILMNLRERQELCINK